MTKNSLYRWFVTSLVNASKRQYLKKRYRVIYSSTLALGIVVAYPGLMLILMITKNLMEASGVDTNYLSFLPGMILAMILIIATVLTFAIGTTITFVFMSCILASRGEITMAEAKKLALHSEFPEHWFEE